jgi:hypothetical protein
MRCYTLYDSTPCLLREKCTMNIYYVREKLRNCSIYDIELNVAYYARVSTEKVEQQASIKHQEEHFEELIHSNNRWKFAGSYIDDGISGIHADKREEFQKMLRDAKLGKIDMIITKAVSSPGQLEEWAKSGNVDGTWWSVVQSNFQRTYRAEVQREQERRKLSPDLLKIIDTARLGGAENCQIENHGEN